MTVVAMSHGELSRYDTLLRVTRRELRVEDAAAILGMSRRQISRLLIRLDAEGPEGLVSRKRGRPGNRRHSDALREQTILALDVDRAESAGTTIPARTGRYRRLFRLYA